MAARKADRWAEQRKAFEERAQQAGEARADRLIEHSKAFDKPSEWRSGYWAGWAKGFTSGAEFGRQVTRMELRMVAKTMWEEAGDGRSDWAEDLTPADRAAMLDHLAEGLGAIGMEVEEK